MSKERACNRLRDIRYEMIELADEALGILYEYGKGITYERAYRYWYAHISGAISKIDSEFLGGSMFDMDDSIAELCETEEEEEE